MEAPPTPRAGQQTHLVLSALGADHPGLLDHLTRAVLDCGCNIGESRITVMGGECALIAALSGNWNAIAKLENCLPRLGRELDLEVLCKRTEAGPSRQDCIPYAVEIIALDRPGIIHDTVQFFALRKVNIEDLFSSTYTAPQTGAPMYSLHLTVSIPADLAIATVRGEFMDYCDELNLDAVIAPVK